MAVRMDGIILLAFHFIVVYILPLIQAAVSYRTASACFGSGSSECYSIHMDCTSEGRIEVLAANYGYKELESCRNQYVCNETYMIACCQASTEDQFANFTDGQLKLLHNACSGKPVCKSQAVQGRIRDSIFSSFVVVQYTCNSEHRTSTEKNKDLPLTDEKSTKSTAAIVTPLVILLLLVCVAAAILVYWRRKQYKKNSQTGKENQAVENLGAVVQNQNYFMPESPKHTEVESVKEGVSDQQNIYHTIDPQSIPNQMHKGNEYMEFDSVDPYNVIDSDSIDLDETSTNGTKIPTDKEYLNHKPDDRVIENASDYNNGIPTTHDYFILEPGDQSAVSCQRKDESYSTNMDFVDYNTINAKPNEIVKDPRYQRLATVDQTCRDLQIPDHDNSSV